MDGFALIAETALRIWVCGFFFIQSSKTSSNAPIRTVQQGLTDGFVALVLICSFDQFDGFDRFVSEGGVCTTLKKDILLIVFSTIKLGIFTNSLKTHQAPCKSCSKYVGMYVRGLFDHRAKFLCPNLSGKIIRCFLSFCDVLARFICCPSMVTYSLVQTMVMYDVFRVVLKAARFS